MVMFHGKMLVHQRVFLPHHCFPRSTCAPPDALGVAVGLQHGLQEARHPIESIQLDAAGNRRAVQGYGVEILVLSRCLTTVFHPWDSMGFHGTMMELLGKTYREYWRFQPEGYPMGISVSKQMSRGGEWKMSPPVLANTWEKWWLTNRFWETLLSDSRI